MRRTPKHLSQKCITSQT